MVQSKFHIPGLAVLSYLALGTLSSAQEEQAAHRSKLAEMIAFVRRASEPCGGAAAGTNGYVALALLMLSKPTLTEAEVSAKEKDVEQLRASLAPSEWCKLYAIEMEQARIIITQELQK
jgi:hypothetical protein